MTTGLPASRLVNIGVSLTPSGASYANIDSLLVVGDSNVIDTTTRIRSYSSLLGVAGDFGTSAPEYTAASLFFSQTPTPLQLYIGKWARTATAGALYGGTLTAAQQLLSLFTAVTAGGFKIAVNGGAQTNVSPINLSGAASLSAVAAIISTALTTATVAATCTWTGSQFVFTSSTTGTTSNVTVLSAPTSGTDVSLLVNGTAALGAYAVAGIAAESLLAAVQACDSLPTYWYGLSVSSSVAPAVSDYQAVAAYIETTKHLFGLTTNDPNAITSGSSADIGSILDGLGTTRTFGQYSSLTSFAETSVFGSLFTTNFLGTNTMPTAMWKPQPGVAAEPLTTATANTLDTKKYNYFTNFQNGASILVGGRCFNTGFVYIDQIFGLDWLQNYIQTNVFNLLVTNPKIPQTDAGITQIINVIEASLNVGVKNGLIGTNLIWNYGGFGSLATGDVLSKGYYVYAPSVNSQSTASRQSRTTPLIQIAVTLAGAVHSVSALISVAS